MKKGRANVIPKVIDFRTIQKDPERFKRARKNIVTLTGFDITTKRPVKAKLDDLAEALFTSASVIENCLPK